MKRDRQARWDKAHMRTLSTRLPEKAAMEIRLLCALEGVSVFALLQRLLKAWAESQYEPISPAAHLEQPFDCYIED